MVFYYTTSNIAFITLSLHYVLGFFPGSTVFESLLPILKRVNSSFCCFQFHTPCLTSLFPWLSSLLLMCLKAVIPSLPCSSSLSLLALHSSFKTLCVCHTFLCMAAISCQFWLCIVYFHNWHNVANEIILKRLLQFSSETRHWKNSTAPSVGKSGARCDSRIKWDEYEHIPWMHPCVKRCISLSWAVSFMCQY